MTHFLGVFAASLICLSAGAVSAETVGRACLNSDREKSNARLCKCIQSAADATLNRRDQKRAAQLFLDPEKSQSLKMSKRRTDEKFWDRYQEFGKLALAFCS